MQLKELVGILLFSISKKNNAKHNWCWYNRRTSWWVLPYQLVSCAPSVGKTIYIKPRTNSLSLSKNPWKSKLILCLHHGSGNGASIMEALFVIWMIKVHWFTLELFITWCIVFLSLNFWDISDKILPHLLSWTYWSLSPLK